MSPGLYIHVPFCRSKCPYCAFYSIPSSSLIPIWLNGLKKEVLLYKGRFDLFDSLYVGGGTPTFLEAGLLADLMKHLFTHFDFAPDTEVTIEANPCDLTDEKTRMLRDLGVNRVNVGVQSLDDDVLSFLGRRHRVKEVKGAMKRLRGLGFKNVGMDLIYGFKEQGLKGWLKTLDHALSFQPEHISCYQLTFEKKTVFGRLMDEGQIEPLMESEEADRFLATSRHLEDNGYIHYEISNFAKNDVCRSRHNQKYWQHIPYLGLGPSAHSFHRKKRWWNVRSIKRYCAAVEKGRSPVEGWENLTEEQLWVETLALGLRTSAGIDLSAVKRTTQSDAVLSRLQASGLVKVIDERIIPSREGFLVADHLPVCFFE
jgi:oxygen-independent coproporphyrinogen-3 oxidase